MTAFWYLLIYTSVVSFFGTAIKKNEKIRRGNNYDYKSISLFFAIMSFVLLFVLVGARSGYNDTWSYRIEFERYITTDLNQIKDFFIENHKSKYFKTLEVIFKHYISENYNVWFFVLGFFQIGAIVKFFYKFSNNFFLSSYLYIASTSFTWLMSGIRQFLAVCIVLYGVDWLIQRKTAKFLLLVLVASLFHVAALIWIPVYFICASKPWSWKMILFVVGIFGILFSLDTFTNILSDVLEDTNYSGLAENLSTGEGMNVIRLAVNCVPWVLALFCKRDIEKENNTFLNICVNLSLISSALYLVASFTSGIIVGRLPGCFTVFDLTLIPWILDKYFSPSIRFMLKFACVVLYLAYFYYAITHTPNIYESTLLGW